MTTPNEGSDFSFDLVTEAELSYDHDKIAARALWPMAKSLWGGRDWLTESLPGPDFTFPMADFHDGKFYETALLATCQNAIFIEEGDDDEAPAETNVLFRTLTLGIEEVLDPERAQTAIALAESVGSERARQIIGLSRNYPDAPDCRLVAKEGTSYKIDSLGGFSVVHFTSIQDTNGDEIWNNLDITVTEADELIGEPEDGQEPEEILEKGVVWVRGTPKPPLVDEDIDSFIIAGEVLKVDPEILAYLRAIKTDPTAQ